MGRGWRVGGESVGESSAHIKLQGKLEERNKMTLLVSDHTGLIWK